jgi:dGTPase
VDFLEKRYEHDGLNLTNDTREGIIKQGEWGKDIAYPYLKSDGLQLSLAPAFEVQAVLIADDIGTQMESLDDGLRCGEFDLDEVERLSIVKELVRKIGKRYLSLKGSYMKISSLNRGLTHLLVTNIIYHSSLSLEKWMAKNNVDSTDRFYERRDKIRGDEICFPPKVGRLFREMKLFISMRLGNSAYSQRAGERARRIIEGLFTAYCSNPLTVDDYLLLRHRELKGLKFLRDVPADRIGKEIMKNYKKDPSFIRLICDHIAGMTDNYALKEYERIGRFRSGHDIEG